MGILKIAAVSAVVTLLLMAVNNRWPLPLIAPSVSADVAP
jgi:hypothetical protein